MKDSRINILFLITFSTFFGNFNDINWLYWLQYIATVLDQELLDYLQQIIQSILIRILFMPSLVTFNGLFYNMSLVIYPFWIAFPVVKSFNTTDLFYRRPKNVFQKPLSENFCFFIYYLYSLPSAVFIESKVTFIHSLVWLQLTFFNSFLVSWVSINSFFRWFLNLQGL